jgi:hypothetical protein
MCQGFGSFCSHGRQSYSAVSSITYLLSVTGAANSRSALLDQALKIFNLDSYHRPEAARAHYKKGSVMKKIDQEEEAKEELDMALDIFNSIVPPESRVGSIDELDDEDFDHQIMFWSR